MYPNIFTPVHVIFLELVMGPTCSIVYENEPIEKDAMKRPPRKMTDTFLNIRELSISIVQGLIITAGVLFIYQYAIAEGYSEQTTRGMVFTAMIFANVFLCLVNRSFVFSVFESLRNRNKLFPVVIGITLALLFAILYVPACAAFFKVDSLSLRQLCYSVLVAAVSVFWFEVYKWLRYRR